MKIYITSCETTEGSWRHQELRLVEFSATSKHGHTITQDPAEADIIFIGNLRDENHHRSLVNHPVVNRFPNKSFAISDSDFPVPLLRGIYASASKRYLCRNRLRSGSYTLYHSDFQNPAVVAHQGDAHTYEKRYLMSFTGRRSHPVRNELLALKPRRDDILLQDTSHFNLFTHNNTEKKEQQFPYAKILEQSKFSVCPRGAGTSSIRLFEAMQLGVAPVIVSDDWILPKGPDWSSFSIILPEGRIHEIERVVAEREHDYKLMGELARRAHEDFFAPESYFDYLVAQANEMRKSQLIPEGFFWSMRKLIVVHNRVRSKLRLMATR